ESVNSAILVPADDIVVSTVGALLG
ncbi:MAG: hypothetical protein QOH14_1867, partial [Pseudonocardiales bacterium]|nr:hypothetical protein [Pseudonocardiales bacterium]